MHEAEEKGWSGEETIQAAQKLNFDWTTNPLTNPLTKFFEGFLAGRKKK
ncbi:MAG: hypothetical protein HYY66_01240 [Candidatus Tectomicrobia bacterium]|nr:hypothetical protein [Candidatus Tectomicrobia bacterium]